MANRGPSAADAATLTQELRRAGGGQAIGRYTMLRRIAAGGMAEVWVARSQGISGFEKRVAIKKILPQYSDNDRFIDMLVDEAKITVSLTHPNIAQVLELGRDENDYFIVMEFVAGRPLNKLMQRMDERGPPGTISVHHAVHIMGEVAKGLDHAHRQTDAQGNTRNIVHRDVSPQNVLISYRGDVKLIDFGIARAEGRLNQTNAGVIKGKLRYLAPEIAAGQEPDHRADIFCCGIVLFEMLTGEAMFAPRSDLEAIELATQAKVKSPRSRNPVVPRELDDIVMRCLERDRRHRFQSGKELHAELRRFLNHQFPSFIDSDLGDVMRSLFAQEIQEERHLDELADQIANEANHEDPETTGSMPMLNEIGGYRQLVTRVGIEANSSKLVDSADGGRAMRVVPMREADDRPLIKPEGPAGHPSTLPPQGMMADGLDGPESVFPEPTVRATNPLRPEALDPFRLGAPSVLPTVAGPPPGPPMPEVSAVATEPEATQLSTAYSPADFALVAASSAEAVARPLSENPTVEPLAPNRPPWGAIAFLAVAGIAGLVAIVYALSSKPAAEQGNAPIQIEPVQLNQAAAPVALGQGSLRLEIAPEVPTNITVDDVMTHQGVIGVALLENLSTEHPPEVLIEAEGYKEVRMNPSLKPGGEVQRQVDLTPAWGIIKVIGMRRGWRLEPSAGRVDGDRIVELPLGATVKIHVDRPGTADYTKSVIVVSPEPVSFEVPAPPRAPRGTFLVTSYPKSKVYLNGKFMGRTPWKGRVRAGTHTLKLKGPGGKVQTFKRRVRPGRLNKFRWNWPRR